MEIGNKIVYPMHGAGIVTEIAKEDFFGEEMKYCTIEICSREMTLKFPLKNALQLKIRPVSVGQEIEEALRRPITREYMDTSNWNKRYQATLDKMKIGTPEEMAEVIVNLRLQDIEKGLSSGERQLYHQALDILASEYMLGQDVSYDRAFQTIEKIIEEVTVCEEQQE